MDHAIESGIRAAEAVMEKEAGADENVQDALCAGCEG
jgi:hypothetical protein